MSPKTFVKRFDRVPRLQDAVYTCIRVIAIPEIGRARKRGRLLQQPSFSCVHWSDGDSEGSLHAPRTFEMRPRKEDMRLATRHSKS